MDDHDTRARRGRRSTPPTHAGSSTATSSPPTSSWQKTATSTWPTSGSPAQPRKAPPRRSRQLSGTLEYVAPEQIEGDRQTPPPTSTPLGCVLYHTLAGQPPFAERTQMELLWAHFNEEAPSLHQQRPELPEAVDLVIAKALAKEPAERYAERKRARRRSRPSTGVGLPAPRMSRRRLLFLAAGGAVAVAAATGVPAILLTRGNTRKHGQTHHRHHPQHSSSASTPGRTCSSPLIPYGQPGIKWYSTGELAVGEGAAWVIDRKAQTVNRIESSTNTVSGATSLPVPVGHVYSLIGVGLGGVWVVTRARSVTRIDPGSGLITDQIPMPRDLRATWLYEIRLGSVWVDANDSSVWRINP